jgi:hypothetical protein
MNKNTTCTEKLKTMPVSRPHFRSDCIRSIIPHASQTRSFG